MNRLATHSAERPERPEQRDVLSKAVVRSAERLGLSGRELAATLGLSPASVSRLMRGDYTLDPKHKSWELATLLVRLVRGLDTITADDEQAARAWFDHYNKHLQVVPREHVASVEGLVDTLAYVDAFRARI